MRGPRLDRYREHDVDLPLGSISARADREPALRTMIERALGHGAGRVRVADRHGETLYSTARACPGCGRSFDELDPRLFSYNSGTDGVRRATAPDASCAASARPRRERSRTGRRARTNRRASAAPAPASGCAPKHSRCATDPMESRSSALSTSGPHARPWRASSPGGARAAIARDVLAELGTRLDFLCRLGLGYLRLDRSAPTLSGGEAQRIRLAAQLGSNLSRRVLHPRRADHRTATRATTAMLLDTLRALRAKGNTVVVGRARRGDDPQRRTHHRPRSRGRRERRQGGRARGRSRGSSQVPNP